MRRGFWHHRCHEEGWRTESDAVSYSTSWPFFNDTATTEIYTNLNTLSLHDALP
eukprot:SAG25_NODE_14788_length_251_cov_0.578947_1_plen_53_part_01